MGVAQLTAVESAHRRIGEILRHAEEPGDTFSECVATLLWLYTALVGGMMSLTAAMSGPLAALRALGALEEHSSRHRTVATAIYDLEPLRPVGPGRPSAAEPHPGQLPSTIGGSSWPGVDTSSSTATGHLRATSPGRGSAKAGAAGRHRPRPGRHAARRQAHLRGTSALPSGGSQPGDAGPRQLRSAAMVAFSRSGLGCWRWPTTPWAWCAAGRGRSGRSTWPRFELDGGWLPSLPSSRPGPPRSPARGYHLPDLIHRSDDLELFGQGGARRPGTIVRGLSLVSGEFRSGLGPGRAGTTLRTASPRRHGPGGALG
jgi:hypothetical protein